MNRLYVYYRVPEARLAEAVQAVRAVQAGWAGAEVLRRPGAKDGLVTLMEIYPSGQPEGAEVQLAAALRGLIEGERHVEVFEPLP